MLIREGQGGGGDKRGPALFAGRILKLERYFNLRCGRQRKALVVWHGCPPYR